MSPDRKATITVEYRMESKGDEPSWPDIWYITVDGHRVHRKTQDMIDGVTELILYGIGEDNQAEADSKAEARAERRKYA